VEAAHSLLDRGDGTQLTLQEVAAAAGVTRATIYKSSPTIGTVRW
jgi:AcrR family transcriptional regulator